MTESKQYVASSGEFVFRIQSISNEKQEGGATMVLARWADTWIKKSSLLNETDLHQPNSLDALVDAAVRTTDTDGNYI